MTPSDATADLPHGGRLGEARRRFPGAPEPWIDLSTGINPVPYPRPALDPAAWARLPEPETLGALGRAAAAAYRVRDPACVVAAPGTQILISLLPYLLARGPAAILGPTYGEHLAAWRNADVPAREIGTLDDLGSATVAVLCNPNNPDGRRTSAASLLALAERLAARNGFLVVDEAFADFDPDISVAPSLPHPGLVVLRSFGKVYGLAGLRLGFALCNPALATRLRTALGPWAVSGPAAAIGTDALSDGDWLARTGAELAGASARLDALLRAAGLTVLGGTALFRLAEHPEAAAVFDRLGAAGLLVRRFDAAPSSLRFGLPADQPAWERLETALRR